MCADTQGPATKVTPLPQLSKEPKGIKRDKANTKIEAKLTPQLPKPHKIQPATKEQPVARQQIATTETVPGHSDRQKLWPPPTPTTRKIPLQRRSIM